MIWDWPTKQPLLSDTVQQRETIPTIFESVNLLNQLTKGSSPHFDILDVILILKDSN